MKQTMNYQLRKCFRRGTYSSSYSSFVMKRISCVILLLTISISLIEGSHLPASYIKDTIRKAEEQSSQQQQLQQQQKSISLQPNGHLSPSVSSSPPSTNSLNSNEDYHTGSHETTDQLDYLPTTVLLEQGYHKDPMSASTKDLTSSEEEYISTTTSILNSMRYESNSDSNANTKPKLIKQDDEVSTIRNPLSSSAFLAHDDDPEDKLEDLRSNFNVEENAGTDVPPKARRPTPIVSTGPKLQDEVEDKTKSTLSADGKRYHSLEATCDEKLMTITGNFVSRFKGRIYAYGYPDEPECGVRASSSSSPQENTTLILPLGECGVQMLPVDPELEDIKRHEVTLYIQYSSFLQQIIDDKVTVNCVEVPKSPIGDDGLQPLEFEEPSSSTRQGRRMNAPKASGGGQTKITSKIGESWMEILAGKDPSPKSRKISPVAVGQDVTLVISTKVMRGYDARIVNCTANDGSRLGAIDGYRSQQILDSAGCSVDTSLVPNFRRRRLPIESRNRMITLHFATFPAFKFPERDHLHVKCIVAYCQGPCPQEPCDSGVNHFGTWREKYGRIADALIDTTEIVNSVEVTAPDLDEDTGGGHYYERHQSGDPASFSSLPKGGSATDLSSRQFGESHGRSHSSSSSSAGDSSAQSIPSVPQPSFVNGGNVCVSPGSVILALVILGVVLVISATATLWFALKRSEHKKYRQAVKHTPFQHGPQPYYRFSHW